MTKTKTALTLSVPKEISYEDLSYLLGTIVEGNYMTRAWATFNSDRDYDLGNFNTLGEARKVATELGLDSSDPAYCWLSLLPGCAVIIHEYDECEADETTDNGCKIVASYRLDFEAVKRGLERMAVSAQYHFDNFVNDNYDIITADVFAQMALLGEIRYG